MRMIKSIKGIPTNTIQGTNESVRINVRWYSGSSANASPKRYKNSVMEGYMTTQVFKDAINRAFFILLLFLTVLPGHFGNTKVGSAGPLIVEQN
jgi:hypothetical protein